MHTILCIIENVQTSINQLLLRSRMKFEGDNAHSGVCTNSTQQVNQ